MLVASGSGRSAAELSVNELKVPASSIALIASLETRLVRTKLLIGVALGLCIGALIGGLAFGALTTDSTATAFLRLQNPADLTAIAGGASQITPDNQGNSAEFVAGEIAYLSGEGFAQAVARKMAEDEPAELNIAQASESSVVTISYSGGSDDEAIRTVQAAIDLYRQEVEQRVDEQLRTILPTLAEWQRDSADALRIQDLQRMRESVELQAAEAGTLLVMQPPIPNYPSSQQWLIGVFLGALVGGSGTVAVLLAKRRRAGRGALVKTLTESVDGLFLPAIDLDMAQRAGTEEYARLGRTLITQCRSAGPARVILVIGASPTSGSSEVASMLTAAAQSQPVADESTRLGQHSLSASPATQVVAGGAVGDSTLTPGVIAAATDIVLVARIEADTAPQVLALRSVTASSTAAVVAAFTYRRSQGGRLMQRRSTTDVEAAPSPAIGVDEQRRSQ